MEKLKHIELFAGCGGMSLGLESAGFELFFANELSPMAGETFAYNILNEDLECKFLQENGVHDYENQEYGTNHKIKLNGLFVLNHSELKPTEISLYRSNGRGDFRIWFSELKEFAKANDELILIVVDGEIIVMNFTRFDYSDYISKLNINNKY